MNHEEVLNRYKDDLLLLGSLDTVSSEKIDILQNLKHKLEIELDVHDIDFDIVTRKNGDYIKYTFNDNREYKCAYAINTGTDNFPDSFVEHMEIIKDGLEAVKVLNKVADDLADESAILFDVQYQWGRGTECNISYWDYSKVIFRLSNNSLLELVRLMNDANVDFEDTMRDLLKSSFSGIDNIVKCVTEFNRVELHNRIGAHINGSLEDILSNNMITREDAIKLCKKFVSTNGVQKITVLNIVKQLGNFLVLQLWDIDYKNKEIETSIIGDRIIDLDSSSILSNETLRDRLDNILKLSKDEMLEIMSE